MSNTTLIRTFVISSILFATSIFQGVVSCKNEDRLIAKLFEKGKYQKLSRPVVNVSDLVIIELGLVLEKIVELNELQGFLKTNIWHVIKWNDYRLTWNPSEYDGLDVLYMIGFNLWIPDILQANNAKDDEGKVGKSGQLSTKLIRVTSDGNCFWNPAMLLISHCEVNIAQFPFDEQHCSIEYELWGHDSGHVQLKAADPAIDLKHYQKNGEWNLVGVESTTIPMQYPCCKNPYNRVKFLVHLRRKSLYYIFNFVIPCCAFSVVSLATFLLQPGCGERIGLSVSVLLGLSVYQSIINAKLPATSDCVPLLGIYYLFVMVMAAMSVIMSIVVISLCNSTTITMPNWMKHFVSYRLAVALGLRRRSAQTRSPSKTNGIDALLPVETTERSACQLPSNNHGNASAMTGDDGRKVHTAETNADRCIRRSTLVNMVDSAGCSMSSPNTADRQLKHLTTLLQTRMDEQRAMDLGQAGDTVGEWMLVARVIDRVCFILFSMGLIVGTLAVSLKASLGG